MHQPYQEGNFGEVIERNELQEHTCELVDECKGSVAYPVGQPLFIFTFLVLTESH